MVYEIAIGVRTGEAVVAELERTDRGFSERESTVPGDPHALVPEAVAGFRRTPSTGSAWPARESEMLRAATVIESENLRGSCS